MANLGQRSRTAVLTGTENAHLTTKRREAGEACEVCVLESFMHGHCLSLAWRQRDESNDF